MPPGQRGRGRGGSSSGFGSRGGSNSNGRGGTRGRGGGRGRGGRGGRGRGGIRSFENRPRDNQPTPSGDEASSDEEAGAAHNARGSEPEPEDDNVLTTEDEEEPEDASVKPYNVLLKSLTLSRKSKDTRDTKRRKTQHVVEEENPEEEWAPVDEEGAEDEEEAPEEGQNGEDSDDEDQSDPFESHFASPTPEYLARTKAAETNSWEIKKLTHPALSGKLVFSAPAGSQAAPGKKVDSIVDVNLKTKLVAPFEALNGEFTPVQQALAPYIFANQDVLFTSRTPDNAAAIRNLTCIHALNHIYKTRSRVLKNNERLSRATDDADLELRDQGFTRPKVLFLLPTRNACAEVVNTLLALSQSEQQENKKRFTDSFTLPPEEERIPVTKPADFRELFSGNHDDLFRIGLKFTRKSVKLFSQFYTSDIILASPLGLRMVLGNEGDRKRDYDFLSSLELVVVDYADALLMQNWEHVEHVFKHLNLIPKDAHGCDFGRVRSWYLDSQAKYLRQTIMTATFLTPELNALFGAHMRSIAGRIKTAPEYAGTMTDLGLQVRQTFMRFDAPVPTQDADARFTFFTAMVLPGLQRSTGRSVVFVNSYYDFVRVRNHLDTLGLDFGVISEETAVGAVARARSHFKTGRFKVLLYTGRAHHFRRYEVAGAKEVVFYQVPDNERFYREVAGGWLARSVREGTAEAGTCRVRVMFSRWDVLRLERVVGSKRVGVMCTDVGDTFEFV
ncbi:hypothetical protein DFP73DRAFT_567720 [Morchella snyderi]|nr:hypothetical protein DFP73DRAFT_567720 [Morchella snyderi]